MADGGQIPPEGSSPSPIRDEGIMGRGGRKAVALGITLVVLICGGLIVAGGTEEIGDLFDDLAEKTEGGEDETTTLEDTTITSGEFGDPAEPEEPVDPVPPPAEEPVPGSAEDVQQQFENAQRQLRCLADAETAEQMTKCVELPG